MHSSNSPLQGKRYALESPIHVPPYPTLGGVGHNIDRCIICHTMYKNSLQIRRYNRCLSFRPTSTLSNQTLHSYNTRYGVPWDLLGSLPECSPPAVNLLPLTWYTLVRVIHVLHRERLQVAQNFKFNAQLYHPLH